jgi:hypothetical protein
MTTAVEFPNVTLWVTQYLRDALQTHGYPTIRVADTKVGDVDQVWVQRDGGPTLDQLREVARIRINVFANGSNSGPVDNLAQRVSTLMRSCANGNPVVAVRQTTGPTPIADTTPRRLLNFELTIRGTEVI